MAERSQAAEVLPNVATFACLMGAWIKGGEWEAVEGIFDDMLQVRRESPLPPVSARTVEPFERAAAARRTPHDLQLYMYYATLDNRADLWVFESL